MKRSVEQGEKKIVLRSVYWNRKRGDVCFAKKNMYSHDTLIVSLVNLFPCISQVANIYK